MAGYPREIAEFLQLSNANSYTGHCFKRTGATLLANSGCTTLDLKRAGCWKSESVAERYVANSESTRMEVSKKLRLSESCSDLGSLNSSNNQSNSSSTNYKSIHYHIDMKNSRNCHIELGGLNSNENL